MKNRYGVDVSYFRKELDALSRSLQNRPPEELARYLKTLAKVAEPVNTGHSIKCVSQNFIHLEPGIKFKDRIFENMKAGDKITVTLAGKTRTATGCKYTEMEIEPVKRKKLSRIIEL